MVNALVKMKVDNLGCLKDGYLAELRVVQSEKSLAHNLAVELAHKLVENLDVLLVEKTVGSKVEYLVH